TPDEVGGRQVFVTGDGDERDAFVALVAEMAMQPPRHVFDEARLPTTRRAFEQHGDVLVVGRLEQLDLIPDGEVERLAGEPEVLDLDLLEGLRGGHRPPACRFEAAAFVGWACRFTVATGCRALALAGCFVVTRAIFAGCSVRRCSRFHSRSTRCSN